MRTRIVLVVIGAAVMAYAVAGAITDPDVAAGGVLLFLAGVLAVHDLVWMVAVLAAGAAITRLVPARRRTVARGAAITAATVALVAFPLVAGFGRSAGNPSALPLPYGRNLALVLLGVIAGALLIAWRGRRKESERPGGARPGSADR